MPETSFFQRRDLLQNGGGSVLINRVQNPLIKYASSSQPNLIPLIDDLKINSLTSNIKKNIEEIDFFKEKIQQMKASSSNCMA